MELKGKCAVVTGGGSGLGRAAVHAFAAAGARVAVLDVNADRAQTVVSETDGGSLVVEVDVGNEESVEQAMARVTEEFGAVHVCVNAAGVPWPGKIVSRGQALPMASFRLVVDVNLMGTFDVMRRAAELMVRNEPDDGGERGVIVNVSSGAAWQGQKGQAAYAASKAAIIGLTLPVARDLASYGVRVVAIAPGLFKTGMTDLIPPDQLAELEKFALYPKRMGNPEEFGLLARHIVENTYLNATTISLDGGGRMA